MKHLEQIQKENLDRTMGFDTSRKLLHSLEQYRLDEYQRQVFIDQAAANQRYESTGAGSRSMQGSCKLCVADMLESQQNAEQMAQSLQDDVDDEGFRMATDFIDPLDVVQAETWPGSSAAMVVPLYLEDGKTVAGYGYVGRDGSSVVKLLPGMAPRVQKEIDAVAVEDAVDWSVTLPDGRHDRGWMK